MPIRDIVIDASPKEVIEQLFSWVDRFNERLLAHLSCVSYAWPKSDLEEALLNPLGTAGFERRMEMEIASVRDAGTKILKSPDTTWCTGIAQPDDAFLIISILRICLSRPQDRAVNASRRTRSTLRFALEHLFSS